MTSEQSPTNLMHCYIRRDEGTGHCGVHVYLLHDVLHDDD